MVISNTACRTRGVIFIIRLLRDRFFVRTLAKEVTMVTDFSSHAKCGSCIEVPKPADAVVVKFLIRFIPASSVFKLAIVGVGGAEVVV